MVDFTLLELHFEDSDLTANAPYSSGQKAIDASETPPTEESSSKKGAVAAVLVGLVFSIAIAYVVKTRVLGGDDPGEDDFEFDA